MTTPLYEKLIIHLTEEIKKGTWKKGDRVPSEKELAEQFGVSRITSKKALERLEQAGLITRQRGKGSFVAQDQAALNGAGAKSLRDAPVEKITPSGDAEEPALIGVILEDFAASYGLNLLKAIEKRCAELGYLLLMRRSNGQQAEEERAILTFLHTGIKGLIIYPVHGQLYNAAILRLVLDKFPLVLVDRYLKGIAACAVYTDNCKAAYRLTGYLLENNYKEIAFISPPAENTSTIEERLKGFRQALAKDGRHFNSHNMLTGLYSTLPVQPLGREVQQKKDRQVLVEFLQSNPQLEAFVACEYALAELLSEVLQEIGREGRIVCFDSLEERSGVVNYTHIQQDEEAMGTTAVNLIHAQLNHLPGLKLHNTIDFHLIEANSPSSPSFSTLPS